MRPRRSLPVVAAAIFVAGCTLYSDVAIAPLIYVPANIERGSDIPSMLRKNDYMTAVLSAPQVDARSKRSAIELGALGEAEFVAGRFDAARRHLRAAIELQPFRTTYAQIAWDLSQLEYMSNNYEASLDWAKLAAEHGTNVRPWHLEYLTALHDVDVYHVSGKETERMSMRFGRPDVPRVNVSVNEKQTVPAMIDSGAVLSIMSSTLAKTLPVRRLGTFEGVFAGLLGEPITVQFGIIDTIDLGGMRISNVPVAIMPDDKMKFVVTGKKEFKMDLLLGAHFLKEFRIELDFRRNVVTLMKLTPAMRKPAGDQNLFFDQFRPAVRGTLNRRGWYLYLLDTGSEVTFLNERDLRDLPVQTTGGPKMHNATLQGLGGATKHGAKLDNIELGVDRWAGTFRTLPMYEAASYERTAGILGQNYLKNFDVVIDFGRMRVDLAPIGVLSVMEVDRPVTSDEGGRLVPP
jgi:hypothetical protein